MHGVTTWKLVGRPVRLLLFAVAMAWSTFLWAQSGSPPGKERLYIASPPSVLDGPIVKRCLLLAGRRSDPQLNSVTTAVDKAVDTFNLEIIFDAVATCRAALATYPTEPKVIVAHYNASETLSALVLGLSFPDSERQAFDLVLQMSREKEISATSKQALSFFLGSAYEYGVGVSSNFAAAIKWYTEGSGAGDPISQRELSRLRNTITERGLASAHQIGSPSSVLDGPIVKRCLLLAGRRSDPQLNSVTTAVDKAVDTFNVKIIFDAVATCRAALATYANKPKVIVAHYNASETLSALVLGLSFPDSERQAFDLVLQMSKEKESSATSKQALSFFLGSGYEYGVGTPIDLSAAMKWYTVGAVAGDSISERELARLQTIRR